MTRRITAALFVACAAAATTVGCAAAEHNPAERDPADQYIGRWNYDQPDHATMTNFAVEPSSGIGAPQIGDIVFTSQAPGRITGRTDVGCTWQFRVTADGLVLDPAGQQLCHNPTLDFSYTMDAWTVTIDGEHETESIRATSHHADGDYRFVLERGARTKAPESDPGAEARFAGSWVYGPSDPKVGANTRVTISTGPDGRPVPNRVPQQGIATITRSGESRLTAQTDDGCTWSMITRGNTAKLDPPVQTCTLGPSAVVTLNYWTIASDGHRQISLMTGTDRDGARLVVNGDLTRG